MIDLGISKMALIGAVALIVIGPEKLPKVARTVGTLLGKAQRYVADVKAEVNRSMELDELKKMKESFEGAARDVQSGLQTTAAEFESQWSDVTKGLDGTTAGDATLTAPELFPEYKRPNKHWRVKRSAVPRWYKAKAGVRGHVQSGAARVARHRPKRLG